MARPSKVEKLPAAIREEIARLRNEQHWTLDRIVAHLRTLGLPEDDEPSRSGVARHIQGLDKLAEKVERSRTIAEAIIRRYGDAPENRTARLNIELLHSTVTDLMLALGDGDSDGHPVTLDPRSVHDLAKALDHLSRASRADADLALRVKKEVAAEAQSKLKQLEDKAGIGKRGLDVETLRRVREEIYGIPPEQAPAP